MRDYKKLQNKTVGENKIWAEKGEKELGQYLTNLSQKLGREVRKLDIKLFLFDKISISI